VCQPALLGENTQLLRQLKLLRVLRPLRLIQRNEGMRVIVSSLLQALPSVADVFFVLFALQVTNLGLT
jgi:hypothetical protein